MNNTDVIGFVAGALTSLSIFPQVVKIFRTRSGEDVSFLTYGASAVGLLCWLAYGVLSHQIPIIVWNAVGLSLSIAVLSLKLWFKSRS